MFVEVECEPGNRVAIVDFTSLLLLMNGHRGIEPAVDDIVGPGEKAAFQFEAEKCFRYSPQKATPTAAQTENPRGIAIQQRLGRRVAAGNNQFGSIKRPGQHQGDALGATGHLEKVVKKIIQADPLLCCKSAVRG